MPQSDADRSRYTLSYEGGEYRIWMNSPTFLGVATARIPAVAADAVLSVDARFEGSGELGNFQLGCRSSDALDQGYRLTIEPDTGEAILWRQTSQSFVALSRGIFRAILPGPAINRIALRCHGDTISGIVNGQILVTARDSALPTGQLWMGIGLKAGIKGPLDARFDNLTVASP